ncbi:hypothetical protein [Streptomyces sp. NPDC059176]|uniref:hypothetical protein n=1 Tax=unclassified Streptomyces TaxID=2593676 RepID=UPI00369A24E5
MTVVMRRMHARRYRWAGLLLVSLLGVSSCAGSSSYEIPETLCGRSVDAASLRPLLPDGKEIKGQVQESEEKSAMCVVVIDGRGVLFIEEFRDQGKFDVLEHMKESQLSKKPAKSYVPGDSVIADGNFVSMNPCPARGDKSNYILDVFLEGDAADTKKLRKELETFAASYLPEGLKKMGCVK